MLAQYLKHTVKLDGKVYVVGSTGIAGELEDVGIPYLGMEVSDHGNYFILHACHFNTKCKCYCSVKRAIKEFNAVNSYQKVKRTGYVNHVNSISVYLEVGYNHLKIFETISFFYINN